MSETPISGSYIKEEGRAGRIGVKMIALVAESESGRVYISPSREAESIAKKIEPSWKPELPISGSTQYLGVKPYGINKFSQIFTNRQTEAIVKITELFREIFEKIKEDAICSGFSDCNTSLREGGKGAKALAEALIVYLALAVDKVIEGSTTICTWSSLPTKLHVVSTFGRQAIPMTWDFAEANIFADSSGNILRMCDLIAKVLERQFTLNNLMFGWSFQADATRLITHSPCIVSTDPPYFDNVPYADLSDFFYVWLRRSLKYIFPDIFATMAVPKTEELVAFSYRHKDGKSGAERFFLNGMTRSMNCLAKQAHAGFPVTVYYAFRQSETDAIEGTASTGWDNFLAALIESGFSISGTWPVRTERSGGFRNSERNSLASSIILVCRKRSANACKVSRRDFLANLRDELPQALVDLQRGNIAPVDLAQAAIGPGMAVYTRYSRVVDAQGNDLSVREALALINQTLDEVLAEQEGDFDADTRWALAWFEQSGFTEGAYGVADVLARAKNTSVASLAEAGILQSRGGKVRLFKPTELAPDWNPTTAHRLSVWETTHQLIRTLEAQGEAATATLLASLGDNAEVSRELAYRLYTLCERKKRAAEALSYNGLVQSWPEISRLARESGDADTIQSTLNF